MFEGVAPDPAVNEILFGSTDVADVSWITPTVQAWVACYAFGTPMHSWQMVSQGQSALAHAGMVRAARVLTATAIELVNRPELIAQAQAELLERRQGKPYECPIPADVPLPFLRTSLIAAARYWRALQAILINMWPWPCAATTGLPPSSTAAPPRSGQNPPAARARPSRPAATHSSCSMGEMYCSSPSVASGMRRAPAANSSSGTAVIGPTASRLASKPGPACVQAALAALPRPGQIGERQRHQQRCL